MKIAVLAAMLLVSGVSGAFADPYHCTGDYKTSGAALRRHEVKKNFERITTRRWGALGRPFFVLRPRAKIGGTRRGREASKSRGPALHFDNDTFFIFDIEPVIAGLSEHSPRTATNGSIIFSYSEMKYSGTQRAYVDHAAFNKAPPEKRGLPARIEIDGEVK